MQRGKVNITMKEMEYIQKNHRELLQIKVIIIKIKNLLEVINSSLNTVEFKPMKLGPSQQNLSK